MPSEQRLSNHKQTKRPLLVIGGETDTVFPVKNVQDTAKAYGTEAIIVPDTAHDMMLEPRWQETADHIVHWVRENFAG